MSCQHCPSNVQLGSLWGTFANMYKWAVFLSRCHKSGRMQPAKKQQQKKQNKFYNEFSKFFVEEMFYKTLKKCMSMFMVIVYISRYSQNSRIIGNQCVFFLHNFCFHYLTLNTLVLLWNTIVYLKQADD